MVMQSTVQKDLAAGIVGEYVKTGPRRANIRRLESTAPALNVIGRIFQQVPQQDDLVAADLGVEGICAGMLAFPKRYALQGTAAGGTLAPNLTLPNATNVEMIMEGTVYAVVANAGAGNLVGNILFYNFSTGEISSDAPGTVAPAGTAIIPNGVVANKNTAGGTLTEIYFNIPG
jgi:hypothetical protein